MSSSQWNFIGIFVKMFAQSAKSSVGHFSYGTGV